ncbi:MAG: B12-binding domain-containing radical SAM protein, partial [Candidatus Lokiarchaeota archaeon]|nr:B12-binding domain-containing radical SAM protein [Candidatus Lokiarchaeota archaeon]
MEYIYRQPNPPIGLGYLAAILDHNGYHVDIIDLTVRHITRDTLVAFINKKRPIFIGLTSLTAYYESMKRLSLFLRSTLPSMPIVIGGVHPSSLPEHALVECHADFVVIGEGEATILELTRYLESGGGDPSGIDGIAYKKDGNVVKTKPRELIKNLDTIPAPAWHKIDPRKYPKNPHGYIMKHNKVAPVLSTRGCPFSCKYCASCQFWKQTIRYRDPKKVVDEIQYLHDEFGIREIHFWDDNITMRRSHIEGICKEILRRGLHTMAFSAPNGVRVDTLDESLLRLMKKAGFYELTFAVESGSRQILRENGKSINLRTIIKNTLLARKAGILMNSYFMLGFPGETEATLEKTIRFSKALPVHYRTFFIVKPLPGSEIFSSWSRSIDLMNFDWDALSSYMNANQLKLNNLDEKYLTRVHKRAHYENNYRLGNFLTILWLNIRFFHFSQVKFNIERISHMITGYGTRIFK